MNTIGRFKVAIALRLCRSQTYSRRVRVVSRPVQTDNYNSPDLAIKELPALSHIDSIELYESIRGMYKLSNPCTSVLSSVQWNVGAEHRQVLQIQAHRKR